MKFMDVIDIIVIIAAIVIVVFLLLKDYPNTLGNIINTF